MYPNFLKHTYDIEKVRGGRTDPPNRKVSHIPTLWWNPSPKYFPGRTHGSPNRWVSRIPKPSGGTLSPEYFRGGRTDPRTGGYLVFPNSPVGPQFTNIAWLRHFNHSTIKYDYKFRICYAKAEWWPITPPVFAIKWRILVIMLFFDFFSVSFAFIVVKQSNFLTLYNDYNE